MRWTWSWWCIALLMLGILLVTDPAVAGRVDWDTLFAGEVASRSSETTGWAVWRAGLVCRLQHRGNAFGTYSLTMRNFPRIFPDIHTLRVLAHDQQGARLEYWVNGMLSKYHYVLYRHYDEPGRRLTWTRVSGDLKRIEGSWEIRETPRPPSRCWSTSYM